MARHNDLGKWGEDMAVGLLTSKGYIIIARNWMSGHRDIDIVALTPDRICTVFVEVKTRQSDTVTRPEDAVTANKIRNIALAANAYVKKFNVLNELRFDIITIVGTDSASARIEHIEEAFNPILIFR